MRGERIKRVEVLSVFFMQVSIYATDLLLHTALLVPELFMPVHKTFSTVQQQSAKNYKTNEF